MIDCWLCLPSSDWLNAERVKLSLSQVTQANTHTHLPLSATQLWPLHHIHKGPWHVPKCQKEPTVQTCPKKVVSTEDLCLAPLRCWIFTLQASVKALRGPIAQSAIWERLTPTAAIDQANSEEEWTTSRKLFELVFEHVPLFLTTKIIGQPSDSRLTGAEPSGFHVFSFRQSGLHLPWWLVTIAWLDGHKSVWKQLQ